ncbi:MAG: nucleoside deaminase [Alphaproteobacteria bacterium]|jgi:tRNA(Arg) A34 adenosine deaminase TadA|nr:nucleoside deaminase [Alphaproteobacteria bacterium]
MKNNPYMNIAIAEAEAASKRGEIPVGAVIVLADEKKILARSGNMVEVDTDPTGHAEIIVLREAALKLGTPRLSCCDIYVTLEPCAMCAQAISFSRIRRVYFGAYDYKGGGVENGARIFNQPTCHHVPEVIGGIEEVKCANLLKEFFAIRRK